MAPRLLVAVDGELGEEELRRRARLLAEADPEGIVVGELLRRGFRLTSLGEALRWHRYRQRLLRLLRRTRDRFYRREIDKELKMTMVAMAGFYAAIGDRVARLAEEADPATREGRELLDLLADMRDAYHRTMYMLQGCIEYTQKLDTLRECMRARTELALRGARNPAAILELLRRGGPPTF